MMIYSESAAFIDTLLGSTLLPIILQNIEYFDNQQNIHTSTEEINGDQL